MSKDCLISVVVPIYNAEIYLRDCIESIINQNFRDFEIILVDDGSTDESGYICDTYCHYDNVTVLHKTNGGLVSARKEGVLHAKGRYVTYVDSDDWIGIDRLKIFAEEISNNEPDIICTGFTFWKSENECSIYSQKLSGIYRDEKLNTIKCNLFAHNDPFIFNIAPSLWSKCFKRELLIESQTLAPENVSIGEDAIVTYPCISKANAVTFLEDYSYFYRTNMLSMTHKYDKNYIYKVRNLLDSFAIVSFEKSVGEKQLNDYMLYLIETIIVSENKSDNTFGILRRDVELLSNWTELDRLIEFLRNSKKTSSKSFYYLNCISKNYYFPFCLQLLKSKIKKLIWK